MNGRVTALLTEHEGALVLVLIAREIKRLTRQADTAQLGKTRRAARVQIGVLESAQAKLRTAECGWCAMPAAAVPFTEGFRSL